MNFGDGCYFNANSLINAGSSITFGDKFLCGWNASILDGDGHSITNENGEIINGYKPIEFGRHCWVAAHATVLKGVKLNDDVIVPYGSVITKSCEFKNVIFGGQPNVVLKSGIKRKN